jgi:uncharacterized protein (DUF302 family)
MQIASFAGFARLAAAFAVAALASVSHAQGAGPADDGLVKVRSAYTFDETVERLKRDIASKGIRFFLSVDQSKLAADAGIALRPSTLLIFGNPPLGAQFLTANAYSGLDWPVRLLVLQDEAGRCGRRTRTSTGSRGGTASRIARRSSTPPPWS